VRETPIHKPIFTGKGKSAIIAEARSLAENDAPPFSPRHRDADDCRCQRCTYVTGRICLSLFALNWSLNAIARALGKHRTTVLYHVNRQYREYKENYAKQWHAAHPYVPRPRKRKSQQIAWDNLGASHDPR